MFPPQGKVYVPRLDVILQGVLGLERGTPELQSRLGSHDITGMKEGIIQCSRNHLK